jgi:hypothetical protein
MSEIAPGRVLAGRYRLEHLLGEGGMGQVWVARHTNLSRMVAVKLMTPEAHASPLMRARFEREARACGQLRSPHVVQVFDYGVEDDIPYLVMELLEGEDLSSLRETKKLWPLAEVAGLIAQASEGLTEAHELGIVHRDIKLSNLFIARVGGQSVLKILDFGIAKTFEHEGPQMTGTNVQMGSPNYMSPEQVMSKAVDGRSDLWALGVVAYRLLTGEPPFRGEASILVAQKIVLGQRLPATKVVDGLPRDIDAFFDRALALLPADRFQTAGELAAALSALSREHPGAIAREKVAARGGVREEATAHEGTAGAAGEATGPSGQDPAFADTAAPDRLRVVPTPPATDRAGVEPATAPTDFNATIPIAASSPLAASQVAASAPRRIETTMVSASAPAVRRGPATTPLLAPGADSSFARTLAMPERSPFASAPPEGPAFDPSDLATNVLPRRVPAATMRSAAPAPTRTAAPPRGARHGVLLVASALAIAVSVVAVWWALGREELARDDAARSARPTPIDSAISPMKGDLTPVLDGDPGGSPAPSVVSSAPAPVASPTASSSATTAPSPARRPGPGGSPRPPRTAAPGPTTPPDDILDTAR